MPRVRRLTRPGHSILAATARAAVTVWDFFAPSLGGDGLLSTGLGLAHVATLVQTMKGWGCGSCRTRSRKIKM